MEKTSPFGLAADSYARTGTCGFFFLGRVLQARTRYLTYFVARAGTDLRSACNSTLGIALATWFGLAGLTMPGYSSVRYILG